MSRKIFFKHLFASIRKRPFQPFLLTIVIAFAVASCIGILNVQDGIQSELKYKNDLSVGICDFRVDSNIVSSSRFFLVDEAKKELNDLADVCGVLAMPLNTTNDELVVGCVTEFSEVTKTFPLYLLDTVQIPEKELSSACLITQEKADSLHLSVGSTLTVSVLGIPKTLTVYGIARYSFLDSYDIMLDSSSFLSVLADTSLYLALSDYQFPLSNSLYVKAKEGTNIETLETKLHELYRDKTISPRENIEVYMFASSKLFIIMVLITMLFVGLVIYCCCNILSMQRQEETFLLECVGAQPSRLGLVSALEMAIYAAVGSILGCLLSLPIDKILLNSCELIHITPTFHVDNVVLSVVLIFLAAECSLGLQLATSAWQKHRRRTKKTIKKYRSFLPTICIVLFSLYIVFLIITVNTVDYYKWHPGMGMLSCIFLLLFFFGKEASQIFPTLFIKFSKKPSSVYAFKNIRHIATLKNTMGITTLFYSVLFVISFLLIVCSRSISFFKEFTPIDYIVMYSTMPDEELLSTEGVDGVYHAIEENVPYKDTLMCIMATDSTEYFGERTGITELPKGDRAFICKNFADQYCIRKGEYFSVSIGDRTLTLFYEKDLEFNGSVVLIDADYWNLPCSYRLVNGAEGYDKAALHDNLMNTLSGNIAFVLKASESMDAILGANRYYIPCGTFILVVLSLFSAIGMSDNVASSYRSRQEEFYSYTVAGMSRAELKKMKRKEIFFTYCIGFLIFILLLSAVIYAVYLTALGFMMNVFFALR